MSLRDFTYALAKGYFTGSNPFNTASAKASLRLRYRIICSRKEGRSRWRMLLEPASPFSLSATAMVTIGVAQDRTANVGTIPNAMAALNEMLQHRREVVVAEIRFYACRLANGNVC